MNAVISGTAGQALLIDGESLRSLNVEDPSNPVVRRKADLPYLFGEGRDLHIIENTDLDSIVKDLKSESDLSLALDLTLISLDEELEEEIRKDAIRDLDELVSAVAVRERLEGIMYARPLPSDDADLWGALNLCNKPDLSNSFALLTDLDRRQPLISKVSGAWDVIPTKVFGGYEQKTEFQRVAVQRGLFRSLVIVIEKSQPVSNFLLTAGLDTSIRQMHNYRQVLPAWSAPFKEGSESRIIRSEVEEEETPQTKHRRRRGRRIDIDRQAVLNEVTRRKAIISAAIRRRDIEIVRGLIDDLVDYQLHSGEDKHLAKSLCDLAMEAKELGMFSLQLELTQRSISVAPDDGWSWAQHGDALLNMNRQTEALAAYLEAVAFGEGVVAKNGRAEVLRAQGRLDDALEAYEEVIAQHPEDVVAKAGRAEVLKAQGRLDDALSAYDEVIAQHSENIVAKNGRAEVLKAQGRLDDALSAYDEVIAQHPEDVVAKNGRAELLKAQGRMDDALEAYDEVIAQHSEDVVAKTGRAEVLKVQGRLDDALSAYDEVIAQHPEDVVAKSGRAEVLRAQGRLDDALSAYDEVIAQHSEDVVAKTGRAEVLKAQGRMEDALEAYDEVIAQHSENVVAKNGRAEVLKAQGRLDDALSAYDEVIAQHPEDVVAKNGRAELLKAQGRMDDALSAYDEVIAQHPENVVAKTSRAGVLKVQGRLDDALSAYHEVIAQHSEDVVAKNGRAEVLKAQGRLDDALSAYDEVIAQHPEDVVAKNGRAELLKAQGRLDDALSAYDEVIAQHAENVVAKNGLVTILVATRRYEEALRYLPITKPVTLHDWIGYHILGMIRLRTGKMAEAIRIFDDGVRNNPWPSSREYFSRALALAWLRGRDFQKASKALEDVKSPLLQPVTNVLRIHAFGAQGKIERASIAYESLSTNPDLRSTDLTQELHSQFILKKPARKTEEWILDKETEILLLAA